MCYAIKQQEFHSRNGINKGQRIARSSDDVSAYKFVCVYCDAVRLSAPDCKQEYLRVSMATIAYNVVIVLVQCCCVASTVYGAGQVL